MKNIPKETTDALIALGWKPPEETPKREPVHGWINDYTGNGSRVLHGSRAEAVRHSKNSRSKPPTVEVIEAGYVLPVKHNGTDQCPVDPFDRVLVYYALFPEPRADTQVEIYQLAKIVDWNRVTHYAVLTPRKELK